MLTLEPIPKSKVGAGPLAHVIVSKPVDHLPLHRQESILARHGWDVRRSTLCDHLRKCGDLLTPLYELMRRRLLQSFALHADDTPLVLLRPRRTAFAWVYLGDAAHPYSLLNRPPPIREDSVTVPTRRSSRSGTSTSTRTRRGADRRGEARPDLSGRRCRTGQDGPDNAGVPL